MAPVRHRPRRRWALEPAWLALLAVAGALASGLALAEAGCVREPLAAAGATEGSSPVIVVRDVPSLRVALARANGRGHTTIALDDGVYPIEKPLAISGDGITIRGLGGDRERVMLLGKGMRKGPSHIFQVSGSDVTLADLSAGQVSYHVVQVHGESDADRFHAYDVKLFDAREQILKVSYRKGGPQSDDGVIEWSRFEFTKGHAPQAYTGGIDAIGARNWSIRDNVFLNIRVPPETAGQTTAIIVWQASAGTDVERNLILNSDTGIRLGLGMGGHGAGRIVGNVVHAVRDVGISLEKASGVLVANNTVLAGPYPNAIEYRFPESRRNLIVNNLVRGAIIARDQGEATLEANVEYADPEWFVAPSSGDFRLARGVPDVVDRGIEVPGVERDAGCRPRRIGPRPDIGAFEWEGFAEGSRFGLGILWRKSVAFVRGLPNRILYWGAGYRKAPARVVLLGAASVGATVGLAAFAWLLWRDRRRRGRYRLAWNVLRVFVVFGVLSASLVLAYLVVRHGPREVIGIAIEKTRSLATYGVMWLGAPAPGELERHGSAVVYARAAPISLDALSGEASFSLPVGVAGLRDLKLAFNVRAEGASASAPERLAVSAYDLEAADNLTAPPVWADRTWRTRVRWLEDFVYAADYSQPAAVGGRLARVRFRAPAAAGPIDVNDLVLFRGKDRRPPSAPEGLEATRSGAGVELLWSPSRDELGLSRYVIARQDGEGPFRKIAEAFVARHLDRSAPPGPVAYRVLAVDLARNLSGWSRSVAVVPAGRSAAGRTAFSGAPGPDVFWFGDRVRAIHERGAAQVVRGRVLLFGGTLSEATSYGREIDGALGRYRIQVYARPGWRTAEGRRAAAKILDEIRPEFCLVLLGTYDSKRTSGQIERSIENLKAVADAAAERGVVPVVSTLPPRGLNDRRSAPERAFNAALVRMLVKEGLPVADLFAEFQRLRDWRGRLGSDGVHWGPKGFELAARAWRKGMDRVEYVLADRPGDAAVALRR